MFERARNSAPCVIFFDEVDALCPRRSYGGDVWSKLRRPRTSTGLLFFSFLNLQTNVSARVVNQMLTEMDGLSSRKQVFVMAATNRPGNQFLLCAGRGDDRCTSRYY